MAERMNVAGEGLRARASEVDGVVDSLDQAVEAMTGTAEDHQAVDHGNSEFLGEVR